MRRGVEDLVERRPAAMDVADAGGEPSSVPLLEELEASTRRATALYRRIRSIGTEH